MGLNKGTPFPYLGKKRIFVGWRGTTGSYSTSILLSPLIKLESTMGNKVLFI
ncbi:hypothetical protein J2Z65_005932 [Paenibacillus aceris]|uniref:Uncharacterized protein n=1 Tax=Paenibacillus aceris TaxID=869555 RepID=A0ABS4I6Y9_9BACL|nr:hypothetical protein [Paenibacillus aceris]